MKKILLFLFCIFLSEYALAQKDSPQGAVLRSLRNNNNTPFYLNNSDHPIYMDDINNIHGDYWSFYYYGTVSSIGDIDDKPSKFYNGWSSRVALQPGCGYIGLFKVNDRSTYVRIYVEKMLSNKFNEIIGAQIMYEENYSTTADARQREAKDQAKITEENAAKIFWDGSSIPDKGLRKAILRNMDFNHNGIIETKEMERASFIFSKYSNCQISFNSQDTIGSLKGIEKLETLPHLRIGADSAYIYGDIVLNLPNLEKFRIYHNKFHVSKIDLSNCLKLQACEIEGCFINKDVNLSNLHFLSNITLNCRIEGTANLSGCNALEEIGCQQVYAMKNLNLNGCKKLTTVLIQGEKIESINVSDCSNLKRISTQRCGLKSLNLTGCLALESLWISCENLLSIDTKDLCKLRMLSIDSVKISSIDLRHNPNLEYIGISNTNIQALDVSMCYTLESLLCHDNNLTSLNISDCDSLRLLKCYNNKLTELNLNSCDSLKTLACYNNKGLRTLDLSTNTKLETIMCQETSIEELDISKCQKTYWENNSWEGAYTADKNCWVPWSSDGFKVLYVRKNQKINPGGSPESSLDGDDWDKYVKEGKLFMYKTDKSTFTTYKKINGIEIEPTTKDLNFKVKIKK